MQPATEFRALVGHQFGLGSDLTIFRQIVSTLTSQLLSMPKPLNDVNICFYNKILRRLRRLI